MLYETLSVDFVPEIGKMIEAKDKAMRKKLLMEMAPRRASDRIASKVQVREEEEQREKQQQQERRQQERAKRARMRRRNLMRILFSGETGPVGTSIVGWPLPRLQGMQKRSSNK